MEEYMLNGSSKSAAENDVDTLRQKKYTWKSGRWNLFYHSPACIVECVSEYIFLISEKRKKTRTQKAKETKEEKRISVENLTKYHDIICKFAVYF